MNYEVIAASIKKTIIGRKIKSLIAVLLLTASSVFAQVPSYVPTNGLVGWWPFNGNANDESGNGNNGMVNGATLTADRSGVVGKSFNLNGSSDYISVPYTANLVNLPVLSLSVWVKLNSILGFQRILHQWGSQGVYTLRVDDYNGLNEMAINLDCVPPPGGYAQFPLSQADTSQWINIVVTYDNTSIKLYRNGLLMDDVPSSGTTCGLTATTNSLFFGCTSPGADSYNGKLDDIGIWNRALTQQEITALYNSQTCNSSSNTITADGPTTFCAGNSVNLKSDVVGGTYQWKKNGVNIATNSTSRTFKASSTGSYTCVATCNGTALTSNAIQVTSKTNAFASVSASGATSFCAGDSVTLNATNLGSNYSVQWYRTNVSIENATAYSQVVKQPGTYKVVTKNLTTGCSRISGSSAVVAVSCRLANPDVIVADITESDFAARGVNDEAKGKIYIYPNPTSDNKFTVELMGLELNGDAILEVYNAMGQILSSEKVNIANGTFNRTIQIDEQSKGQLCLVRLIVGREIYDSKVILK